MSPIENLADDLVFEEMKFCPICKKSAPTCDCEIGRDPIVRGDIQDISRDDLLTEEQFKEKFGEEELKIAKAEALTSESEKE